MFCEECKVRPASVHITKIINQDKTEVKLCEECAKKYQKELGFQPSGDFSIQKFLTALLESGSMDSKTRENIAEETCCSECGLSYRQFHQTGKLGCANCYDAFGEKLESFLKRIHGTNVHQGKFPKRSGADLRIKQEIKRKREELQALVMEEKYEQAAVLRDQIKNLEISLEKKGDS